MKIGIYQMNIVWEDKEQNLAKAEQGMITAVNNNADVLFMPEMSFTGFSMNTKKTAEDNNYTVDKMKQLCKKHNIAVGFGWVRNCGEKSANCYSVIDKNGELLSTYEKIHPFSYSGEDKYFQKGSQLTKYSINDFGFSTAICYDTRFPELFQGISKDKAVKAIVIPANWTARRSEHWKTLVRARAIENQVYIIAVNCVGNIGGTEYSGDSCVITPNGDIEEYLNGEQIYFSQLDYDIDTLRQQFPVKQDRQPQLYKQLL